MAMPAHGLPGVAVGQRGSRRIGIVAAVLAAAVLIAWRVTPSGTDGSMSVSVLTDSVGTGIKVGNDVRLDGVQVGRIADIAAADGHQRITLSLGRGQLFGLTDAMGVDYVPGNLFGVAEIDLQRGSGGQALVDRAVIDLTGPRADRARDATIATLLHSVGTFSNDVLTPQLMSVLERISSGTAAFTPLIESIIAITRAVADTQRLPSSFLLAQYGSALSGLPSTLDGVLRTLGSVDENIYLSAPEHMDKFNASTEMLSSELIPAAATLLGTGQRHLGDAASTLVPVLQRLARTVPTPETSGQELSELLRRLNAAMPDSPNGPHLNLRIDLRGVPVLSTPLQALAEGGR